MKTQNFFVTGTDTEIGKTFTCCALLAMLRRGGLRAVGMKPVAAGTEYRNGARINEDLALLRAHSSAIDPADEALINPYLFDEPIAPHIAAARSGGVIDIDHIIDCYQQLAERFDSVIVEGVGGFCVPLGPLEDTAQLAERLALPVILVVGMRLGCINHALLTAQAVQARGLTFAGWVANQIDPGMRCRDENIQALRERLPAPLMGVIPYMEQPDVAHVSLRLGLDDT